MRQFTSSLMSPKLLSKVFNRPDLSVSSSSFLLCVGSNISRELTAPILLPSVMMAEIRRENGVGTVGALLQGGEIIPRRSKIREMPRGPP